MKKQFLLLLLLVLVPACLPRVQEEAPPAPPRQEADQALPLFIEGIDHFDPTRRNETFLHLEQDFPASPWTRRAKIIARLAGSIRTLEQQLKQQQSVIDTQKSNHSALMDLRRQNDLLQEQVKVLKSLIVDLELRQP